MDGIHDMGGMHGFGKVEPEPNEPVFHATWEGHCFAINRAMGYTGIWTIDQTRAGIEELPPDIYLDEFLLQEMGAAAGEPGRRARPRRRRGDQGGPCARVQAKRSSANSTPPTCPTR